MRPILVLLLMALFSTTVVAASGSEAMKVVPAGEIIGKIGNGEPVNYSQVTIKGDLDISKNILTEGKYVNSSINITNSIITGSVNLNYVLLQNPVAFEGTEFVMPASFIGTKFKGGANFKSSRFDGNSLFIESEFNNSAMFHWAEFKGFANFLGAKFKGVQDFHNCRFNDTALFRFAVLEGKSDFNEATFVGPANFRETQFDDVKYSGTRFMESADFNLAQFGKFADFSGTGFYKELYFNDIKFGKLLILWDSIDKKLVCNGPTYLLLIKNFKDMEQFEDAENCYYQFRDIEQQQRPLGWAKAFDYLALITCGYGVRWQNTLLTGIGTLVLFGIYFSLKGGILSSKEEKRLNKLKSSLFFSLTVMLSAPTDWYINLFGIENYKDIVAANKYSIFLERIVGMSLLILLVNTLSRVMIRY